MPGTWRVLRTAVLALAVGCLFPTSASAGLDQLLTSGACVQRDAADDDTGNGVELPYTFCDDGVPNAGGTTPNVGADKAVAVPAKYTGEGQPDQAPDADSTPGADPLTGKIALDVDLSLPDRTKNPMPAAGYPVVVMMHGCCSGSKRSWERSKIDTGDAEGWHYSNAWFASRGFVVVNYTSRGFVDANGHGSTGEAQLDSDLFEINDFQYLVGLLANQGDIDPVSNGVQRLDPQTIVATGGSYGGGFSWMALTDPTWNSPPPGGVPMALAAVAPKYGWTNLVESLVPKGIDPPAGLASTDPASMANPVGYPKRSIVAGLYGTGRAPSGNHTTFPADIDDSFVCLNQPDIPPPEQNPLCANTLGTTLPRFLSERSAYFENDFFDRVASGDPAARVPVFSAGTFTDPLFPFSEHRRMAERLKRAFPGYPIQEYFGDYQHFTQNKAKEWGDLCGADHHVCRYPDYPDSGGGKDLNATPPSLVREVGITTRLNRFIDYYAKPPGDLSEPHPSFDATASLEICPQNATTAFPADEPGERFTAPTFADLAPGRLTIPAVGTQFTVFNAEPNPHAVNDDPVKNLETNSSHCPTESSPGGIATGGPGVATYDSDPLPHDFTMIGRTTVTVLHAGAGPVTQLDARLYDLSPDGTQLMVDRGFQRITAADGVTSFALNGSGWRFPSGHRIRIELTQDDDPYIKSSNQPSSLTIAAAKLELPIRGASQTVPGGPGLSGPRADLRVPRLASDQGTGAGIRVRLRPARGVARRLIDHYQLEMLGNGTKAAALRSYRRLGSRVRTSTFRVRTRAGRTYTLRARAVDKAGHAGPWDTERTVTPFDDGARPLDYSRGWRRLRSSRAYGHRLSRSSSGGASLRLRFRGDRLYLVARTSRAGGQAVAVVNGRRRVARFRSRHTRDRRVVLALRTPRRGVNRLRLVVVRGLVDLDAVGVRRP